MKIWILDSEWNSLTPDKCWVIVLKEFLKENYHVFINDVYLSSCNSGLVHEQNKRPLSSFKEFIENELKSDDKVRLVGHNNIDFDFHWFKERLGISFSGCSVDIRDSYVLSRLAKPKRPGGHSVEAWGEFFGLVKTTVENEQWSTFDPIMVTRCIQDVRIQEKIYDHLRNNELRGFSLKSIELEHEVQALISEQRRNGVYIDRVKALTLLSITKASADRMELEIQGAFPPKPQLIREYNPKEKKDGTFATNTLGPLGRELGAGAIGGPYSSICYEPFNPSSPKQRIERLLALGWKPTEYTKPSKTHPKGQPKFTEDSLEFLPEDAPKEIHLLGKYLMTRNRQAFADALLDLQDDQGYVHGYIDQLGAATHRMASNSPNLQNVASLLLDKKTEKPLLGEQGLYGYECRDLFCVKRPDVNIFVDADASGIQLRGLAHYGGDNEYIKLVSDPLVDIHRVHADVLECTRAVAKTFIYALLMGAGAKKLASVLGSGDVNRGKELLKLFYLRFPFLKEFRERLDKQVERGFFVGLDGRLIALNREMPHLAMSVALQSYEAIIMKLAMVLYQKELKSQGVYFVQRLMVHDEFLTETKIELGDVVGMTMVRAIVDAGNNLESTCPLAGAYKKGSSWTIH